MIGPVFAPAEFSLSLEHPSGKMRFFLLSQLPIIYLLPFAQTSGRQPSSAKSKATSAGIMEEIRSFGAVTVLHQKMAPHPPLSNFWLWAGPVGFSSSLNPLPLSMRAFFNHDSVLGGATSQGHGARLPAEPQGPPCVAPVEVEVQASQVVASMR